MTPANLDRDIQDAFDGELDEISAQRLRDALRQSPGAIDRYCDRALLESELHRHTAGRKRIPGAVPARTLEDLADALTAPTLLERAMKGDATAARQFLHEAGFTDKQGQWLPQYQSTSEATDD